MCAKVQEQVDSEVSTSSEGCLVSGGVREGFSRTP